MLQKVSHSFGSVAVAMITPFDAEGRLDLKSTQNVAKKLVADGCDAIVVSGTTGESPTTHQPEKSDLIIATKEAVAGKAMIIAGAGSNDTMHAVRMAEGAAAAGADALLVVSPYYNRPSQEGLRRHVEEVAKATDLPIMLYDIPGRTGLAFSDETLETLAQNPKIKAVKDATGNVPQGFARMQRTGLEYYSGDDGLNFAWLTHGASGVISVAGHVIAGVYRKMVDAVEAGEIAEARELAVKAAPIVKAIMGGGQGAVMAKHALHMLGVIATPTLRLPLVPASAEDQAALRAALENYGLL